MWVNEFWCEIICCCDIYSLQVILYSSTVLSLKKKKERKKERKMVFCRKDTYKYRGLAQHKDLELKVWIHFFGIGILFKIIFFFYEFLFHLFYTIFLKIIVLCIADYFHQVINQDQYRSSNRFVCLFICLCWSFWYFLEVIYIF